MSYITDKMMNAEHVSKYNWLVNGNLTVDDAEIVWPNFGGRPTKANPAGGKQLFNLVLSEEMGAELFAKGWNIKVKEIMDNYDPDAMTRTVKWNEYDEIYRDQFDHGMVYVEVIVDPKGKTPPTIFRASEYNGEKTLAPMPEEHWGDIDKMALSEVSVTLHPWLHGRNALNPDAKKPYLNTMIAKMQPILRGGITSERYADYRGIDA